MTAMLERDFGKDIYKATTMNGHIYAVPANKGFAIPPQFVYDVDILNETGFTEDDVNSIEDLPKIYDEVKNLYPDMIPFVPINVSPIETNLVLYLRCAYEIDMLTDPSGVGVVIGDSGEVVNLYETDIFKDGIKMMRNGIKRLPAKDVVTTTSNFMEMIQAGRGFPPLAGTAERNQVNSSVQWQIKTLR